MVMTVQTRVPDAKHNWLHENNAKHQLHPMLPQFTLSEHPPVIIDRADGVKVFDLNGKGYIDCQGGLWCVNAGHGRAEIKQAIVDQLDKLQYYTLFPGSTHGPSIELSAKICEITQEENIKKVFFSSGGSDATESALKIARQYWKIEGQPERIKFISLRNGYHGLHFGGMSACGGNAWKRAYEPLVPGFFQVESPHLYRNPFTEDPEELSAICASLLEREIEYQVPDTVAAVIAEPIQGAGGVIVPPASFWPKIREICDRHGVLLIADEVITGLGRSGCLFGARGWGVKPDIMCMAKGLTSGYIPLGATLLNARVAAAFDRNFLAALKHRLEPYSAIGDIRGKGLMIAVEMVKDRRTREPFGPTDAYPIAISEFCLREGVMVRSIVNKLIISPPLIFTKEHADEVTDVLRQAFEANPF
jgi:adenosylmethionine-8-amino-7-oxononanoate aminotransferase